MTDYAHLSLSDLEMLDRDELLAAKWWLTAKLEFIHVTRMTDAHLLNARQHVIARADMWEAEHSAASSYMGASSDSMASYYADRAADEAWESCLWSRAWAATFLEEIKRRGI